MKVNRRGKKCNFGTTGRKAQRLWGLRGKGGRDHGSKDIGHSYRDGTHSDIYDDRNLEGVQRHVCDNHRYRG